MEIITRATIEDDVWLLTKNEYGLSESVMNTQKDNIHLQPYWTIIKQSKNGNNELIYYGVDESDTIDTFETLTGVRLNNLAGEHIYKE